MADSFVPENGMISVSVGGQVSDNFVMNYEALLPVPVIFEDSVSPSVCQSTGCNVTLLGENLDSGCEVLVWNARGQVVLPALSSTASSLTVRLAGQCDCHRVYDLGRLCYCASMSGSMMCACVCVCACVR